MSKRYKVGIVGLGAIGLQIARTIDQGNISNFDLVAIATRDEKKASKNQASKLKKIVLCFFLNKCILTVPNAKNPFFFAHLQGCFFTVYSSNSCGHLP